MTLRRLALMSRRIPWWGKAIIVVVGVLVMASALTPTREADSFRIRLETEGLQAVRLSAQSLDFGQVETSQPIQQRFTITNVSTEDVLVNLTLESAPPFGIRIDWLVNDEPPPHFLPRGQSVPVDVTIFRTGRESLGEQTYKIAVTVSRAP